MSLEVGDDIVAIGNFADDAQRCGALHRLLQQDAVALGIVRDQHQKIIFRLLAHFQTGSLNQDSDLWHNVLHGKGLLKLNVCENVLHELVTRLNSWICYKITKIV